jgi:integral membrane protein (TIGR01906 family)
MADQTYDSINFEGSEPLPRRRPGDVLLAMARVLAAVLFVVSVPVALLTTNIRFIANEGRVYIYAIDNFGAVNSTGLDRAQLLRSGDELRAYFNNGDDRVNIRVQQNGRELPLFSAKETDHLFDVKNRFRLMNRIQEFSILYGLVYVAAAVLWAREVSLRRMAGYVAVGCGVTLAAIGIAGAIGLSGFDSAWEDFHGIIFSNDFWRLNPATDHLIQMFPPLFWERIVFFIGLMTAAEAALILIFAAIYLGATNRSASADRREAAFA